MRTFLIAAFTASLLAGPAAGATRNFGIEGFTKVRIDGPYKVLLATGTAPFAKAEGSSAALDRVSIEVEGSTLVVHPNRSSWGGYDGEDVGPVTISLGTHELGAAWLNGSGMLAIDKVKGLTFDLSVQGSGAASIGRVDVDQLRIAVGGTGSATVAGQAGKTSALVRGVSSVDASALKTKDAVLSADGSATIALTGAPACTVRMTGSATVSGCGSTH